MQSGIACGVERQAGRSRAGVRRCPSAIPCLGGRRRDRETGLAGPDSGVSASRHSDARLPPQRPRCRWTSSGTPWKIQGRPVRADCTCGSLGTAPPADREGSGRPWRAFEGSERAGRSRPEGRAGQVRLLGGLEPERFERAVNTACLLWAERKQVLRKRRASRQVSGIRHFRRECRAAVLQPNCADKAATHVPYLVHPHTEWLQGAIGGHP